MGHKISQKLAVLGLGKLGGILLRGFLNEGLIDPEQTHATVGHRAKTAQLSNDFGIEVSTDNPTAVDRSEVIFLCVKPQNVLKVCREIRPNLRPDPLLISVAASVPTSLIEEATETDVAVIRAMPNTPCQVGAGMTGICAGRYATSEHLSLARTLFDTIGRTVVVDEKDMNAVTGLSASGPAFIYVIIESLAEAGVKVGLARDVATLLAAQTVKGAAQVALETGHHPALLKDGVTTPAGCTIDGLLELEEGKLRVTLIKAVVRAVERAGELLPPESVDR